MLNFLSRVLIACLLSCSSYVKVANNGSKLMRIADVTVPLIEGYAVPTQGHLAFVDDPNTVAITWVTNSTLYTPLVRELVAVCSFRYHSSFDCIVSQHQQALYGQSPDLSDIIPAKGVSTSYQGSDMCGSPANITAQSLYRDPGVIHTVNMSSLKPSTRYYYQFGNDVEGWSSVHSFMSRPASVGGASQSNAVLPDAVFS